MDKGLGKGNLKIIRAMRIPTARKPGPFKIELESEAAKKEALAETGRLQFYKAQGNKVIIRSSQRFEDRVQKSNWDTMRRTLGLESQLRVSKHGKLLPNTYAPQQQQPQGQQQQYYMQQQQPQMQQQQPQTQQQQPQTQQLQPQMWQQQPQQVPTQQQWQQPQQQVFQQSGQYTMSHTPRTNVTYSNAVQSHGPRMPTAPPSAAAQTNQFSYNVGMPPPRSTAPGY